MTLSGWYERSIAATELATTSFGSNEISRASSWTKTRRLGSPFALPGTSENAVRRVVAGGPRNHFRVQSGRAYFMDCDSRTIPDILAVNWWKWRNAGSIWVEHYRS